MPSLRILLAEDNLLNAMALQAQLEALGHTVVGVATNGVQAVEMAREHAPDLALLDVRMPMLSGLEAARTLYTEIGIPAVMLSGMHDDRTIAEAWSIPVFHYLIKPIPMQDLGEAIELAWSRFQDAEDETVRGREDASG